MFFYKENRLIISACLLLTIFSFFAQSAAAKIQPDIIHSLPKEYHLKIHEVENDTVEGQKIIEIIKNDLSSSKKFRIVKTKYEDKRKKIYDRFLKGYKSNFLASIQVKYLQNDIYEINFILETEGQSKELDNVSFSGSIQDLTRIAHIISDRIYLLSTGREGVYNSKIAYVRRSNNIFELCISDYNGKDTQVALRSPKPIISLSWSPDGSKILYVSFESNKPVLYVHDLFASKRTIIADCKGGSSSPKWSPDGTKIVLVKTETGLSQIYLLDIKDNSCRRLIQSSSCDTEPCFSPDGKNIFFTSDRSGTYQIYKTDIYAQNITRITFNSDYNGSPTISPDGEKLFYIKKVGNKFMLYSMDIASKKELPITQGDNDQSPSISPNGEYIVYCSTDKNNKRSINKIYLDSLEKIQMQVDIINDSSELFEPSCGPIVK